MNKRRIVQFCIFVFLTVLILPNIHAAEDKQEHPAPITLAALEEEIPKLMEEGNIPGLTLVIVKDGGEPYIKSFGYADLEKKTAVTPDTLFELCSLSKAFTALAALKLEGEGLIDLDVPVSRYLEGFTVTLKGKPVEITLRHALHQTTGITFKSVARIHESDADDALQQTMRNLSGFELRDKHKPGAQHIYATINYDIVGAVIEKVTGMSYEEYMAKNVFQPLGLDSTRVGADKNDPLMSKGYKISFFSPREYDAPIFRGNNPAGYIVSSGRDMARWLQFHMGRLDSELRPYMEKSHEPDMSVLPMALQSYAMGWQIRQYGSHVISHGGSNPNYTAFVGFKPEKNVGVVVLANSNSGYTPHIFDVAMAYAEGKPMPEEFIEGRTMDGIASMVSVGIAFFILLGFVYLLSILLDIIKGRRAFEAFTIRKLIKIVGIFVLYIPFAYGIYLLPMALSEVPWEIAAVWTPLSFHAVALLILAGMGMSYIGSTLSGLFPPKNDYFRSAPMVVVLSFLSGGANAVVILLITSSLFSDIKLEYQVYYYVLAFFIYILGRKLIQTRLIRITFQIVYDLRMRLIRKVFLTSYQRFEDLESGRIFATLNNDTGQVASSANLFVGLITSFITTICAFVYLFSIAFWATAVTLGVVIAIATLYAVVGARARVYFEQARDTQNVYMSLMNGLVDGFKELSLKTNKKKQYERDISDTSEEFKDRMAIASINFVNAFLVGESLLLAVLGAVSFAIPRLFPDISTFTLMSFIMVLLYLIGPVNVILHSIPQLTQIRVAWGRVKTFETDLPANIDPEKMISPLKPAVKRTVDRLVAKDVLFTYESENEDEEAFSVGPLDFEAQKGEITFIIGGNGSGKTTLAKLLTGLYPPESGTVQLEGDDVDKEEEVSEYFSAVFSGFHLFRKLYDVDLSEQIMMDRANEHLQLLNLDSRVEIEDNQFSTIDLSGGQRKRLALLQCYLEDSPIYLFDEVAADQDPEFRRFFYRDLLQRMKAEGKIVIAITHDDHYFDVADKIIKMDMGKIEMVDASYSTTGA